MFILWGMDLFLFGVMMARIAQRNSNIQYTALWFTFWDKWNEQSVASYNLRDAVQHLPWRLPTISIRWYRGNVWKIISMLCGNWQTKTKTLFIKSNVFSIVSKSCSLNWQLTALQRVLAGRKPILGTGQTHPTFQHKRSRKANHLTVYPTRRIVNIQIGQNFAVQSRVTFCENTVFDFILTVSSK